MSKHAPLPWVLGKAGDVGYSDSVAPCHIWTEKGPGCGMIATTAPYCQPSDQERADAAFIVLATNSHYKLVEALRQLTEAVAGSGVGDEPNVYADYDECCRLVKEARVALAAAEPADV